MNRIARSEPKKTRSQCRDGEEDVSRFVNSQE